MAQHDHCMCHCISATEFKRHLNEEFFGQSRLGPPRRPTPLANWVSELWAWAENQLVQLNPYEEEGT